MHTCYLFNKIYMNLNLFLPSFLGLIVDFEAGAAVAKVSMPKAVFLEEREASPQHQPSITLADVNMGVPERVFAAAGSAFLSAVIVNPLDVAKVI